MLFDRYILVGFLFEWIFMIGRYVIKAVVYEIGILTEADENSTSDDYSYVFFALVLIILRLFYLSY